MLILERKRGERIVIGDDVFVSIENVTGNKVRLGISAPRSVAVDREEVRRAKDASRRGGGDPAGAPPEEDAPPC
jgi:carbon storage regulator